MEARLEQEGPGYALVLERRLDHPPSKVWRVLTDRELIRQWFPCDVEGEWERGAKLRFHFLHGEGDALPEEDHWGEVLAVDEPWLLEFRWGSHRLKYELAADGDGTLFRLSEHFQNPSWGARNAAGWEQCIDNLGLIVDGASALAFAAKIWKTRFGHYVKKFEPTFGPQHDPTGEHPLLAEEE